jgi:hypothetical protein
MQRDYDAALGMLLEKQKGELAVFDDRAEVQLQKLHQDRAVARRLYENRGRKLTAREAMAADPERLWNHEQAKRSHAIAATAGMPFVPSAKLTRKDVKDKDVAILSLPPLALRRKRMKPEKENHAEEGQPEVAVAT